MNKKQKKPAVIFLTLLSVLLIISLIAYAVLYYFSEKNRPDTSADVFLYEPDWSADILSEEEYIILDRSVKYCDGIGTWNILENGIFKTKDDVQLFLIDYIQNLVDGDSSALYSKYSASVAKELKISQKFTKQRVYDSLFTERSKRELEKDGRIVFEYEFKVEYKIMKNDGTFRSDLASDSVKGQYFTILHDGDDITITGVVEYAVG